MTLLTFIEQNHQDIVGEFTVFARTLMPPGADMSEVELRDHADQILTAIQADMALSQSPGEESRKAEGEGSARTMERCGRLHADDRISHGFTFKAVLAEFRALRATVLRLYEESGGSDLRQVRRFNEAIDETLIESMNRFALQTDLFRDQFIGILSHDLRAPLGNVTMGAALLAMPGGDPQRRQRVVSGIMSSAQRMERMIADLLDMTQVRLGGTIPLKRQRSDLREVCEQVVLEMHAVGSEVDIRLTTNGDLRGDWDPDRLGQVVSNLLGNAIQHGDGTPITLMTDADGDTVTLAVVNGGAPIPPELLPGIFEPMARGHSQGEARNLGLGLFIARAVVSAHGGDIEVASAETGTTFTVTLPRNR